MNLTLVRFKFAPDGIFSRLLDADGTQIAVTLEHAYPDGMSGYAPKVPLGTYLCERGTHCLKKGLGLGQPFETFEVMDVPGHTGILFHAGNFNRDSAGCLLLGEALVDPDGDGPKDEMVTNSRATMAKFLDIQAGVDTFELTVI